jgi:hypothetical protein
MKKQNVVQQNLLMESIRIQRQSQIDSLKAGIMSFQTTSSLRRTGTYACLALYLALLAEWIEKQIATELRYVAAATGSSDCNEIETDTRCAMSFGTLDGASQLGQLSSELIATSQRTLIKAGVLSLCEQPEVSDQAGGDELFGTFEEPDRMRRKINTCLSLTASLQKRCENAVDTADLSVASMATTACGLTISNVLAKLAKALDQPLAEGLTASDPIARGIAEALAADMASNFIRSRISWVTLKLD